MVLYNGAGTSATWCPLRVDSTNGVTFLPALQSVRPSGCFVAPAVYSGSFRDSCVFLVVCPVDWAPNGRGVLWSPKRDLNRWMGTLEVGEYEAAVV
ncbi:unnamed protein product [Laminaria digitata]